VHLNASQTPEQVWQNLLLAAQAKWTGVRA